VAIILCAAYVADAFGSRSLLTTTQVMSILLSKHLQEPGLGDLEIAATSSSENVAQAGGSYGSLSLDVFGIFAIAVPLTSEI